MNRQQLHELLTKTLGLLPESVGNNISRTYFYKTVEWHPQRSTRVFRVLFESGDRIGSIQLCASSDNNNSVLVRPPILENVLAKLADAEIEIIKYRQQVV